MKIAHLQKSSDILRNRMTPRESAWNCKKSTRYPMKFHEEVSTEPPKVGFRVRAIEHTHQDDWGRHMGRS